MIYKNIIFTILPLFWPKMPPLGIGYLQAFLNAQKIEADIMDLNNIFYNLADKELKKSWLVSCNTFLENNIFSIIKNKYPGEFDKCIKKLSTYEIIGFSCFKSNLKSTIEFVNILKTLNKNIKIILGGPEITRQFFKKNRKFDKDFFDNVDFLVIGEGEKAVYDIIKGNVTNKVIKFEQLENLEQLPYPEFIGIDFNSYPRKDAVPLLFSRGCIRKCNFCSEKLLYKGYRTRTVEKIINEIKFHLNNGIKYFIFFDSILNGNLEKFEQLCAAIISNFGTINWEAQIAIRNDMSEILLEKMKKSGCYNLFIGLESGSDNTLKKMNKGFTTHDAKNFFEKLNNAGLFFGISLIIGYPGESMEDFTKSLEFIIQNKNIIPKIEQVNPFTYYDGTNTDKTGDYKLNMDSVNKMKIFIEEIKKNNFKYTNAFLGNLIEKDSILEK